MPANAVYSDKFEDTVMFRYHAVMAGFLAMEIVKDPSILVKGYDRLRETLPYHANMMAQKSQGGQLLTGQFADDPDYHFGEAWKKLSDLAERIRANEPNVDLLGAAAYLAFCEMAQKKIADAKIVIKA